jgi:signal transduction histidine kinase
MFKHLRTSTKLLVLCGAFVLALGAPIYGLVREKQGAIEFARKELAGSRYLATLQRTYEAILAFQSGSEPVAQLGASAQAARSALAAAEAEAGAAFQTAALAQAASAALDRLRSTSAGGADVGPPLLDALAKAQALAWRIGDDSNLALDPDLDTYYVQNIVVRQLPTLLGQLAALQASFQERASSPNVHAARLPILAGLVRSTADEIKDNLQAAYRGNADAGLRRAVDAAFAAMISSLNSYLGALDASALAVDARDSTAANRFQVTAVRDALQAWRIAKAELDRLLQRRIDGLIGKMRLDLALIGVFAALSLVIAALTHRHIVRPLEHLEAVASKVRETKDYGLRVLYDGKDEIGRVTAAFNDMLAELAAARQRETAERAELARVTRLTTMGEMAASIAHEVNQPLAAIVSNANAGLRWLAHPTPDLTKVDAVLQRVVRDGHRASEVIGSVRAMFKRDVQEKRALPVNPFIEEALALLQGQLESERISVHMELAEGAPWVLADRVQLQQVVLNLISNAIDAMRAAGDRPRALRVAVGPGEADNVLIAVEDSGPGIAPEDRERIFEAFFTTKTGGMGLGLAICRSIVEAHGGRLSVVPGTPHGAVFQIMLPACHPQEP